MENTIEHYRKEYNIPRYSDMYNAKGDFHDNESLQSVPRNVDIEEIQNKILENPAVKTKPFSIERELRLKKQRLKLRA